VDAPKHPQPHLHLDLSLLNTTTVIMPLVVGFNDIYPIYEPLPERPPTRRQFTRSDESPIVNLDATFSVPNWNDVSEIGLFGKLARELRDRIYEHAFIATLSVVDAKIWKLVEKNGPVSAHSSTHLIYISNTLDLFVI
jgi:hypothetical protein